MYEELIKSLRLCREILHEDDSCIEFVDGSCEAFPICAYQLMEKAADAIENLTKKLVIAEGESGLYDALPTVIIREQKWIPVTERLPDKRELVLAYSKFVKMKVDFITDNGKWYLTPGVTHWMPLPEPPKEEA